MQYLICRATVIRKFTRVDNYVSGRGGGGSVYNGYGTVNDIEISSRNVKVNELTIRYDNGNQDVFEIYNINIPVIENDIILILFINNKLWSIKLQSGQFFHIRNINDLLNNEEGTGTNIFLGGCLGCFGGFILSIILGYCFFLICGYLGSSSRIFALRLGVQRVYLFLFVIFFLTISSYYIYKFIKQSKNEIHKINNEYNLILKIFYDFTQY